MAESPELLPGQRASNCSPMSETLPNGSGTARRGCALFFVLSGPFFGSVSVAGLLLSGLTGLVPAAALFVVGFRRKVFMRFVVFHWVWARDFAGVTVHLACRMTKMSIEAHIGLCQHNVCQGWRAWILQRWSNSGRHELRALPAVTRSSGLPLSAV